MMLSSTERRWLQNVRAVGDKLYWAHQETSAAHVYSAAMAYIRSLAASALDQDPDDITWTQIASTMKEKHQDIIVLGSLLLDKASCLGGLYVDKHDTAFRSMLACTAGGRALDIASLLLRADCACCRQQRRQLACRSYFCLMTATFQTGDIVEACKIKWVVDRLQSQAFASLSATIEKGEYVRHIGNLLGEVKDVLGAFRSLEVLIEIPKQWRQSLGSFGKGSCWYPAHISCQATQMQRHDAFFESMQSFLINCGTHASQPVFVIRHHIAMRAQSDPAYTYSIHTCRLREEKDGKMEIVCLRVLRGVHQKYKVGAVSGSTLYLTSLMPPMLGDILSVDLTRDAEPEVLSCQTPKFEREVDTMVALGGDLYIHGGYRRTPKGQDIVLADIIVARVQEGFVKQPWKRLPIRDGDRQPSKRIEACFFGHESPEGRLSLYLFGGMQIKGPARHDVDYPLKDLWKLDLATRQWSEPEQRGTRPCVRTMTHGAFMSPDGQKALIAGGASVFGIAHFRMQLDPRDPIVIHLHDMFELDLLTSCWIQIVPNGKKWTSAFTTCAGGYLASNHIGLVGLSRFAGEPSTSGDDPDWTTAVNIRFQRSKDKVNNILAWDRHGFERDRVLETIERAKLEYRKRPKRDQDPHKLCLLDEDSSRRACTILTQNLPLGMYAYKGHHTMPPSLASMVKGRHEAISDIGDSLKFLFDGPWLHPELCPFTAGPHWLGGYNTVTTGMKLCEPLTEKEQSDGPWVESMHHAIRSFPSPRAAVEYFRLMLPPWDADGGLHNWTKIQAFLERNQAHKEATELAVFAYNFRRAPNLSPRQELFAVYVLVVSGHMFAAQLVDMRAPRVQETSINPATSWPQGKDSVSAVAVSLMTILSTSIDEAGTTYQCAYCGKGWNSKADDRKQRPKVCECQMTRYCSQDCQFRHWRVHKPICKAARQPGGITQEQALSFMLTETLQ